MPIENLASGVSAPVAAEAIRIFSASANFWLQYVPVSNHMERTGVVITWDSLKHLYNVPTGDITVKIQTSPAIYGLYTDVDTVQWSRAQYIDVNGTPDNFYRFIIVTPLAMSEPSVPRCANDPATVRVYGYLKGVDGTPEVDVMVYFNIVRTPTADNAKNIISRNGIMVVTLQDGYFETSLVCGIVATITCHEMGIKNKAFIVPSDKMFVNIFDLI